MTLKIAALASGRGSNVGSMLAAVEAGKLDAKFTLVLSNNPEAPVLELARNKGISCFARSHKDFASREVFDTALLEAVLASGADTIVLAGYMRILSEKFVQAFPGRILNIHPAILPSFPGAHGGRDALAYGVRFTGATVHFVDEIMDNGPVIIQAVVPVSDEDSESSLMPRIHALEHRIYPQALQWLAEDRLRIEGRKVRLLPKAPCVTSSCVPMPLASVGEAEIEPWMVCPPLEGF